MLKQIGLAAGVAGLGATAYFLGSDLVSYFNAHAAEPATQSVTRAFGAAAAGISAFYLGCVKMVAPQLKDKAGIITAPIALVLSLALAGAAGYGGYRGANALIDHAVSKNQPAPAKPAP